jgi:energy-converting hydrogenase Eha subunit F
MIRDGVQSWQPKRGADWPDLLMRVAGSGPPPWVLYSVASAALVVIIVVAFLVGSALHIGALAPQPIPANIH